MNAMISYFIDYDKYSFNDATIPKIYGNMSLKY